MHIIHDKRKYNLRSKCKNSNTISVLSFVFIFFIQTTWYQYYAEDKKKKKKSAEDKHQLRWAKTKGKRDIKK